MACKSLAIYPIINLFGVMNQWAILMRRKSLKAYRHGNCMAFVHECIVRDHWPFAPFKPYDMSSNHGLKVIFIKNKQQVWVANSTFGPDHSILLLIKKGEAKLQVNGNSKVLNSGKLTMVPKGELWSLSHQRDQIHLGVLGVHLSPFLEQAAKTLPLSYIKLWDDGVRTIDLGQQEVFWLFKLFHLLKAKNNPKESSLANNFILRYGLSILLWELGHLFQKSGKVLPIPHNAGRVLVLHFMDLLTDHYTKEHKVGFYSQRLQITVDHLSKVVKQHTGKTAKGHITGLLMEDAKALLQGAVPIKGIARTLGFKTLYDFSKFFKRYASLSPRRYREKVKL